MHAGKTLPHDALHVFRTLVGLVQDNNPMRWVRAPLLPTLVIPNAVTFWTDIKRLQTYPSKMQNWGNSPLASPLETILVMCNDVVSVIPESDISSHQPIQMLTRVGSLVQPL